MMRTLRLLVGGLIRPLVERGLARVIPPRYLAEARRGRGPSLLLPDPLLMNDGTPVSDAGQWQGRRRAEILELFRLHVYGHHPLVHGELRFSTLSRSDHAVSGAAVRKEISISLDSGGPVSPAMVMLLYLPRSLLEAGRKVPVFLGLNFLGNHTVEKDPSISLTSSWIPDTALTQGRPPERLRGLQASSWPLPLILRSGYGLATIYCGDVFPDLAEGPEICARTWARGADADGRSARQWRAISTWAWGLSRAMDALLADPDVDHGRVAVLGHSRLGKAALWAGAQDERFSMVVANNSGCGGASLSRHQAGESVAAITKNFPYWFCDRFASYAGNERDLPVDQHELLGLIAPRPVYLAAAELDRHADPVGEFLAAFYANPVFRLLGAQGLDAEIFPPVGKPVMSTVGFHMRRGHHGITPWDWTRFLRFADRHLTERLDPSQRRLVVNPREKR